jgi:hypothetical protein
MREEQAMTTTRTTRRPTGEAVRERLLTGMPVTERRLELAGVSTAVLEGGDGPPVILLHGASEFAACWIRGDPGPGADASGGRARPARSRRLGGGR